MAVLAILYSVHEPRVSACESDSRELSIIGDCRCILNLISNWRECRNLPTVPPTLHVCLSVIWPVPIHVYMYVYIYRPIVCFI